MTSLSLFRFHNFVVAYSLLKDCMKKSSPDYGLTCYVISKNDIFTFTVFCLSNQHGELHSEIEKNHHSTLFAIPSTSLVYAYIMFVYLRKYLRMLSTISFAI